MDIDKLIKDQQAVIRLLQNSYQKNRLVHAYIFEGPRGTKKEATAIYLAMLLTCKEENKPCQTCHNCKRVLDNTHPNVMIISPDKEMIRKEQIEQLIHDFSLTSLEDNNRVYIIKDADMLNISAANSLLKFLEEPQSNIYGILITEDINQIISTIKSRSQIINFKKVDQHELIERLVKRGIDEEMSRILSHITSDEDEIINLINEGLVLDLIDLVKEIGVNILTGNKSPLVTFFEKGQFLLSETKKINYLFLDLLILMLTDFLYYKICNYEMIGFINIINGYAKYIDQDICEISRDIEDLLKYRKRLNYNINLDLFYTEMMLIFAR